ncbi:MAG: carboxylating nicotinate-nucleotide diphosphorylase [Pseudomonadota bacterium]
MDNIDQLIEMALKEDIGTGDITARATIPEGIQAKATINAKGDLVLAGSDIAEKVFLAVDPKIKWSAKKSDGEFCRAGDVLAELKGDARSLLSAERTALNFLQRLSGIATMAKKFSDAISGTKAKILDTRKTTPGFRALEKHAVKMGGGKNHRMGLYDHFLIKNNHIAVAGSVTAALKAALEVRTPDQKIEIETRKMEEVRDALEGGADIIMLDNMSVDQVRLAVEFVEGRKELEVSGGITLDTVRSYAETGVDYISAGIITHSAPAVDINMTVEKTNK